MQSAKQLSTMLILTVTDFHIKVYSLKDGQIVQRQIHLIGIGVSQTISPKKKTQQ